MDKKKTSSEFLFFSLQVTDTKRSDVDVWKLVHSASATRETRMAAFAWVAVTKHDAKLEGGFVRDYIVRGKDGVQRPAMPHAPNPAWRISELHRTDPNSWVDLDGSDIPRMKFPDITPADLDLQLPVTRKQVFDVQKFLDQLHKIGLSVDYIKRQGWRYSMVVDLHRSSGPFTVDIVEPHITLLHDMCDADVNNLYVCAGKLKFDRMFNFMTISNNFFSQKLLQITTMRLACA